MRKPQSYDAPMVYRRSDPPLYPYDGGQGHAALPAPSLLHRDSLAEKKTDPGEKEGVEPSTAGIRKFAHSHGLSPTIPWLQREGKARRRALCHSLAAHPGKAGRSNPCETASRGQAGQEGGNHCPSLCTFSHSWSPVFPGSLNFITSGKKKQKISPSQARPLLCNTWRVWVWQPLRPAQQPRKQLQQNLAPGQASWVSASLGAQD